MNLGDRIQLRFRPLSGQGVIDGVSEDKWRVRLDDGQVIFAAEDDLLLEKSSTASDTLTSEP